MFDNLSAGAYYIGVETLHGMTPTTAVEGTNRGMDSDLTQANGMNTTSIFLVAAGVKLMDIDLGFENIVVPVEMLYFEGANRGQDHLLNWATSIEIDNDFFELQRKINGERQFEIIGSVNGMGNALSLNEYQFIDRDVLQAGHYEYRLRQVDYNGNFEFSDVITIDRKETERDILIYPNPAISYLNINFTEQIDKGAILSILDLSGKLIRTFEVEDGSSNINIDISEFTAGTYFITVNGNGYNFNSKFIKVD